MSEAADGIGSLATGALWAREAEHLAAGEHAHEESGPCPNCGTERVGPYCHACGQAGHVHRNLMALAHDIAHGVFHFEGKLWHTLPLLVWRPGELTRRYVYGERAKFVSPMALFLFSVFLMFAVVSSLAHHGTTSSAPKNGVSPAVQLKADQDKLAALRTARAKESNDAARDRIDAQIDGVKEEIDGLKVAVKAADIVGGGQPGKSRQFHTDTGWRWFDDSLNHMSANPDLALYKFKSYAYKYSWALVPISLPFIWLLFAFRRDVGLYDHAIFSIYSLSFMSLGVVALTLLGRLGVSGGFIALAAIFVPPVHMYRQLKGAYQVGRFAALWRTLALLVIVSITSLLFAAFLLWMGSD